MIPIAAILCVVAASLASLALGLDVGMISSTLVQPTFLDYFGDPSPGAIGGVVAAFSAGATFGAFGCAFIADPFGRLWGLRSGATISVIGVALQAGAVNIGMLIAGRLIAGLGAGQLTAVFPVYASEVAPPSIRGALGGLQMLMIEAAIFVATGAGYGFGVNFSTNAQWRGPLAVQAIPLVMLIPVTFFLPETPRWLISNGKDDKAKSVLQRLHGAVSTTGGFVEGEYQEISDQIAAEKEQMKPSWAQILRRPSWRRRVLLAAGMQTFSQLTGINCVQYYAASIYTQLGFSITDSLRLNLLYGAFGLIFAFVWVGTLDRFRRIAVLITATLFMAAALLVQAVLSGVYATRTNVNTNALNAQVAMFFVFNLFFVAVGMISWLYPPEMSPMAIRAKVNSVSVSVNNIVGLVVAEVSPIALSAIGFKFFFVFFACDIVAAVVYYFFYPETSKLTLEQMDIMFGDQIIHHALQDSMPAARRLSHTGVRSSSVNGHDGQAHLAGNTSYKPRPSTDDKNHEHIEQAA